ncbi:MAG: biotin--[acetyl-CoA-carboxylase] ligase [Synergistaceae bacterium]|nr:biotin--[acetyl-CoA-carboxylase] ligase [Synergistaceae bacterium]
MAKNNRNETNSRAKLLETLLEAQGEIVPGSQLTQRLSSSRQAVFKTICALREEGLPVESIPQRGYRLAETENLQALSPTLIEFFLLENPLFKRCVYMRETDSTQKVLKKMAAQDAEGGVVALSEIQSEGRGRRGRSWCGAPGKNLTFSVLLRPKLKPGEVQLLNLAAGLAVKESLREYCGIPAELKWPNDILCRGRKLCGILSEAAGESDRIYYAVTGIGLNVNTAAEDFPEELRASATSTLIESGRSIPRWKLLIKLLERFAVYMELLASREGAEKLLALYRLGCDTVGREVRVIQDGETFTGRAVGISAEGALIVLTGEGEKIFAAADVFHLRMA